MNSSEIALTTGSARALDQVGVGITYFLLAKGGMLLAAAHPSASAIWPAAGLALAAILIWGLRISPAIFVAAFLADFTTTGTVAPSLAIAAGNTLEAIAAGLLINRFSGGIRTFDTAPGIAVFALVVALISTPISATVGVGALQVAEGTLSQSAPSLWLTWWLGNLAGAVLVAPAIVLFLRDPLASGELRPLLQILAIAFLAGVIAFSPALAAWLDRGLLAFIALIPLLWAALYQSPRNTAAVALVLAAGMIWATLAGSNALSPLFLNNALLTGLVFLASIALPSLALSAERRAKPNEQKLALADYEETSGASEAKDDDTGLRESEDQLQRLINGIHDYAIFMLDPQGRIVSWNAGAARIKQYTREQALGKHVSMFYTPEDKAIDLPGTALKTAAREGRYEGEGWRQRQDGTRFWANVVIDAIHDSHGNIVGFGKITRDVTEKREAMLALEKARDQLAQAQKMETIGQVTGGVAHDFNNLLAAIISSLRLLEKKLPAEPQSKRLLDNALSAAERGASLTQRLLTFARRQDLKPETVDIQKLIAGMTELLRRSIGPSIAITTRLHSDRTMATVDPTQFELALFNLALNARDAMPSGGSLTIEISDEIVTQSLPGTELKPGRFVLIEVTDTGTGMDADTLRRAIEPFFTTKGIGKGTGLGLSMVQGLAAQSGGSMKIESEVGKGTTVSVWIPASDGEATLPSPPEPDMYEAVKECQVLVVDDDPLVSMGTVAMLEDLGYRTIEVSSGRKALTVLDSGAAVDIVITDQAMPGMTGTELVAKIREQRPDMPIILATGWADLPENAMPDLFRLSKPYRQEELARAINRVLSERGQEV